MSITPNGEHATSPASLASASAAVEPPFLTPFLFSGIIGPILIALVLQGVLAGCLLVQSFD